MCAPRTCLHIPLPHAHIPASHRHVFSVCLRTCVHMCVCDLEELMMQEEQYQSAAPQRLPLDELMTHFLTRWQEV